MPAHGYSDISTRAEYRTNSLIDRAALEFLKSKNLKVGFSHYDVWLYEHAVSFTVAKMMDEDMLADVRDAVTDAMQNGTGFAEFKKRLKPYLMRAGWWGEQLMSDPLTGEVKLVQLGSTRRLRTIFHTNYQTAHAAGRWQRIQNNKKVMPYLKYIASTSENKRVSHMAFYGRILPVDDPFWAKNYPPNGYGCKCSVRQLTAKQALRERQTDIASDVLRAKQDGSNLRFTPQQIENSIKGVLDDARAATPIAEHEFINPRTGQKVMVPQSVMPSFAYPIGDRLEAMQQLYRDKVSGHIGREKSDGLMDAFSGSLSNYLLAKIHSIAPTGSVSERIQFEMTRLVGLPPQVSAAVYEKMLGDQAVMQTLTEDVQKVIKTVKETGHTDKTMALHIGTIPQQVLAAINDKKLPEPQTAVISFGSSRYGHGTRTHKSHALDDAFWMTLPHELRQPEAVYYDAGGHGNHQIQKPALLFVYPAEKGKKKLVVTVDYVMKDYRSPVSKTKETLLTNMVNTGEVMELDLLESDKNLELVLKK